MMKLFRACAIAAFAASTAAAQAVEVAHGVITVDGKPYVRGMTVAQGKQPEDPFARYLYPPDLVLDNQREIGLQPAERKKIQDAVLDAQRIFVGLQFVMSQEEEKLKDLLRGATLEKDAVLKQIDAMLGIERQVKHTQLTLMINIKNILSVDQKAALDKIRGR
jgi:hypothetical protein